MFLWQYVRRTGRKRHTYWALVESVRTARGLRQRIVAYLGELTAGQESGRRRSSILRAATAEDEPVPVKTLRPDRPWRPRQDHFRPRTAQLG